MSFTAAVIGLGKIGLGYDLTSRPHEVLSHSKAYRDHPGFRLVAGVDPHSAHRGRFVEFCGAPAYATAAEMFERHRPEVVSICVPTSGHAQILELAVGFAPRAIVCEKPIAADLVVGIDMVELCRNHGITLAVNYMRRFDPGVSQIGPLIRRGQLGKIYKGVMLYSKGLLHNGSHYLDLLISWLGMPTSFRILERGPQDTIAGPEPDVWFEFPDDCRIVALGGREQCYSVMELDLVGTAGRLRYTDLGNLIELWNVAEDPMFAGYRILHRITDTAQPDMTRYQLNVVDALYRHLSTGEPIACTGETALDVLRVCQAVAAGIGCRDVQYIG